MPGLVRGDNVRSAAAMYSSLMEPSLFHSLASNIDMYCPSRKRSRVNAPFNFAGDQPADEEKQQPRSLDDLPDECLFEIFRRLGSVKERSLSACVSKRWLSLLITIRASDILVRDSSLDASSVKQDLNESKPEWEAEYGYLTRSLVSRNATDVRLAAIAVAGMGRLGELSIDGSHPTRGVTDLGLSAVGRTCASLEKLSLLNVPGVTDVGLVEIAAGCPMLTNLELGYCPLISDKSLIAIAAKCPNLLSLTIEACPGINNEGLKAIGRSCKKLQFISITDCPLVGDAGVAGLVSQASSLAQIRLHNLNITDLSLAVIGRCGKSVAYLALTELRFVSERGFWAMGHAMGLLSLQTLFIRSCLGVTDVSLQLIAKGIPSLRQLCLYKCCYLSDAGLKAFVESASKLQIMHLEECNRITLAGVLAGLSHNSKLNALSLVNCWGVKDICLDDSAQLPVCASLESLSIRDCPRLTSGSLAFIGKVFPKIEELELVGLVGLTDAAVLPLIQNSRTGLLMKVSLNGSVNLTDAVVSALVEKHGSTLQRLYLDGCMNVTDKSILRISECCSVLMDLDLSKCGITDYGVAVLASARQFDLKMLALAGCLVTDKCVPFLCNMGKELCELNLQSCNQISASGINLLELKLSLCEITS